MARIFEQMKTTKGRVKALLHFFPHLQNNDFKLIATFWKFEAEDRGLDLEKITAKEFLREFACGGYTHSETIRRNRAKLQEQFEELRGEVYGQRQEDGEEIKEKIKTEL